MDPSQVKRLKDKYEKDLLQCEKHIKTWEGCKNDYEVLKEQLQSIPNALSYDITVPFGPNAFMMGKLVHTNEVMVCLGDNWYAEVSAKQAAEIANRRMAHCTSMLDGLSKEKEQFENWLNYVNELSDENLVDIVEEYDEEKEKEWKIQHAKNVKAYRKKLAEEKVHNNSTEENTTISLEEECLAKLENFELHEISEERELSEPENIDNDNSTSKEMSDSMTDLSKSEESEPHINEQKSEESEPHINEQKSSKMPLRLDINCCDQNSVHETESCDDEDGSKSDDVNANLENCNVGSPHSKHVRWQDLSKQRSKKITFKHSRSKHHSHSKHHIRTRQDSSESDEPQPLIQSPSDIYKHFGSFFQASSPKSILKVKNSPSTPDSNETFFPMDDIVPNDSSPDVKSENMVNAFTGKVFERSSPIHIPEKKSSRPASQFKSSRKNRRR